MFEILSPNNRLNEMTRKFQVYERHGVEEYYVYDPDKIEVFGWLRNGAVLKEIADMEGWRSPRLGIRFSTASGDLILVHPNGEKFLTFEELAERRQEESRRAEQEARRAAEAEARHAQAAAEIERLRARLRDVEGNAGT